MLLFPFGNPNPPLNVSVSVHLEYANPDSREGWYICAQFALAISNIHDSTVYTPNRAWFSTQDVLSF